MSSRIKRILVIDDSETLLSRIKRALLAQSYEVIATTQLVGNARHLPGCDLVIVDYHMPGLNGSSVVESLRSVAQHGRRSCPFYLYTSDKTVAADFAAKGFDGAFSEKGDEDALIRQVAAVFRMLAMREARVAGAKR